MSIHILYQDEHIVVVEKPSMLLSVPGRGADKFDSVTTRLKMKFPGLGVAHRLDWETSGLMVFALHPESLRHLNRQFMQRSVKKEYRAWVYGNLEGEGEVTAPMRCDWENRPRQIVDYEQGKNALTYWQTIKTEDKNGEPISLLKLTPHTGRSHQLRVHLWHLQHPILGDRLYGHEQSRRLAERLQLHATQLHFMHPNLQEEMSFQSACPF